MAPTKASVSLTAVLITVLAQDCVDGFFVPVASRPTASMGSRAMRTTALSNRFEARPQRMYEVWRRQASMSARQQGEPPSMGAAKEQAAEPSSRLSRISRRLRKMIRKAVMGYLPEEEMSYKESVAKAAAAAAALKAATQTELVDERLREDAIQATVAAAGVVDSAEDEDDLLSSEFVQLDIGDQSPMEADDIMASLRKRLEQGMQPDTEAEQAEKRRLLKQQQRANRAARPPSFDGDTAVAERPTSSEGVRQAPEGARKPKETPKLASAEDVERLNRMFGSMGGEPLP